MKDELFLTITKLKVFPIQTIKHWQFSFYFCQKKTLYKQTGQRPETASDKMRNFSSLHYGKQIEVVQKDEEEE